MSLTPITYLLVCVGLSASVWPSRTTRADPWRENDNATDPSDRTVIHDERPSDPWMPGPVRQVSRGVREPSIWTRGPWRSIQVNVDALAQNIEGDGANEPSIAIDPTDPCKMAIGWRQFDTIASDLRQAGWAYSHDRGETWTFTGSLEPGTFGSDPVLDFDADGGFYFVSMGYIDMRLFRSFDGGVTWDRAPADGLDFADKPWMTIDRTNGIGRGNIYVSLSGGAHLTRSTDGGLTFVDATNPLNASLGTLTVAPGGELYAAGGDVVKSVNAQDPNADPTFERLIDLYHLGPCLPGRQIDDASAATSSTPIGSPFRAIGCQDWVATDHSAGPNRGNVYALFCGCRSPYTGLEHIVFVRSTDGGVTWDQPRRVNDDPVHDYIIRWFPTMSVAPNGRIDVVWNDTRNDSTQNSSELFYSYSADAGDTWSKNRPVSLMFVNSTGPPGKLGDYYDMTSDNAVANVAYAATFNGEHDVYFLRVGDCNDNGIHDSQDLTDGTAYDCNENALLDECERGDADGNEQINLRDFADFANCYTGSSEAPDRTNFGTAFGVRESARSAPPTRGGATARGSGVYDDPCCGIMDFDTDGDIDPTDFAAFHEAFNP